MSRTHHIHPEQPGSIEVVVKLKDRSAGDERGVLVLDPGLRTLPAPGRVQLAFARTENSTSCMWV